jgi:hypothetical protein
MSNFWLLVTFVFVGGAFAAMMVDAPKTQFVCLAGAVLALIIALRVERKEA